MKFFSPIHYQHQLIVASLDDFSPNAALPNYLGGQYGRSYDAWRQAVIEFLCVNIKFGLVEATHRPDISVGCDINKIEDMLINGDKRVGMDSESVWNALYFNGTESLIRVVEKFNLRNWNCVNLDKECEGFVSFLRRTYGVR